MRPLALLPLFLVACTGGSSGPSSEDFVEACLDATNWDRPMCECAEEKARADLTGTSYAFVVATLQEDAEATERLRADLSFAEATESGFFMVGAATSCAAATAL